MITELFIDGRFCDTKEKQKVVNPSTGKVITEVCLASENETESVLSAARAAFDSGPWPRFSLEERKVFLSKISSAILDKAGGLANLETLNTGKPIKESTFMDIPSSAKTFEHIADNLEKYLKEDSPSIGMHQARCELMREPRGVVVLIIPWNYPLLIASWKLASALGAGNTVILKPSSLTPLSAMELSGIINEVNLPKGVVNVINGSGEKIGKKLCSDKRADMISFTGSNEAGKQVIRNSADNAKKLIMELGGKSGSIVLKDADFEAAVNGSLCSIFLNQGQMCTAMSRIFVEDKIYDKFVADFTEKAMRIKLGNGLDYETQMGPLISDAQRKKVTAYVERAKKEGARLACGGKVPEGTALKNGFFFEPTVFTDVTGNMRIFREEVFGPVVCVNKFSNLAEAVAEVNNSDFGLAATIWTKDLAAAGDLAKKINAGTIWINTYGMFYNEVPYGGFKQSGFGKELGKGGFLEYTRLKSVLIDEPQDSKPLVNYWYGF